MTMNPVGACLGNIEFILQIMIWRNSTKLTTFNTLKYLPQLKQKSVLPLRGHDWPIHIVCSILKLTMSM